MRSKIVEAVGGNNFNWGKFMVLQWEPEDWDHTSIVQHEYDGRVRRLLPSIGHNRRDIMVMDLETCEGAIFSPGGVARSDLRKRRVWVCVLFEPFLDWLYEFYNTHYRAEGRPFNVLDLPDKVEFPDNPPAFQGHRREGPLAELLKQVLEGDDDELKALARKSWEGLHGPDVPMPGEPPKAPVPTAAEFKQWLGGHK